MRLGNTTHKGPFLIEKLRVSRIGLVKHPATRINFFCVKEEGSVESERLRKAFPVGDEKADEDSSGQIQAALKQLANWREEMPASMVGSIGVLAEALNYGEAGDEKGEDVPAESATKEENDDKGDAGDDIAGKVTALESALSDLKEQVTPEAEFVTKSEVNEMLGTKSDEDKKATIELLKRLLPQLIKEVLS